MRGYKAVRPDMSPMHGDQIYKIGETYEMDGKIEICKRGFHFCKNILDCYNYYETSPFTIMLEVKIPDDAKIIDGSGLNLSFYGVNSFFNEPKFCTNKMKIIRRVSQNEIIKAILANPIYYRDPRFDWYLKFLKTCNQDEGINFDEFELNKSTSLKDLFTYYGAHNIYNNYKPSPYSEVFMKYITFTSWKEGYEIPADVAERIKEIKRWCD